MNHDAGWAKRALFEKLLSMHHAMKAATARDATKSAAPAQPISSSRSPPLAEAVLAPPAEPKQMSPGAWAGLIGFYNPDGSGGAVDIGDEFPPDIAVQNWRQSIANATPVKPVDDPADRLDVTNAAAVQAAFEKQEAAKAAASNIVQFRVSKD
jgi:hypothetical protein